MKIEEFKESLNDFLNEKTYIVVYRSNYDSARDFNNELINYIKKLESYRTVLKSISNMKTGLFGVQDELLYNELYEKTKDCGRTQFVKLLMEKERENQQLKEDISFCLKSIKQEMEISTDSRTRQDMLSCYQILNEWSDK